MSAEQLIIEAKVKRIPFGIVALDDFQYRHGHALDPQMVIERPNVSLYCLDHAGQRAIFVETDPARDLLQAPFYFQAQYEAAQQLIAVPYATLHQLAAQHLLDPTRIMLIYSTGRCGSTLVSRVFEQISAVASFSEPDVFTQLLMLRSAGQASDAMIQALLLDCLKLMCLQASLVGKQRWAFKFRSYVTSLSDLLYQAVPEARLVFLYRHAIPWAISFSRAFGPGDDELAPLVEQMHRWVVPLVAGEIARHRQPIGYSTLLACMWAACMRDALALQRQGAAMFVARYEDLRVAPHEVIAALLAFCGVDGPPRALLERTLGQDSQAGTQAARAETLRQAARVLTEHEMAEIGRLIPQYDPGLAPDLIIPQTFQPSPANDRA